MPTPDDKTQKIKASCLILAGGKGKRLTPDKPLLEIGGKSIIERTAGVSASLFQEVIVVTNTPEKYRFLGLPLVADERRDCGPLMGIFSGLQRTRCEAAFVCAADMPFLSEEIIRCQFRELGAFDIVVPCPTGLPEFLHAFYRKTCLPAMRQNLDADMFKIEMLTKNCKTRYLDPGWFVRQELADRIERAFTNINTVEDYQCWHKGGKDPANGGTRTPLGSGFGVKALSSIAPHVLEAVRRTLIEQETAYQQQCDEETFSSLWAHSSRVARIAHRIAESEGCEAEPALLAGLLHDIGKFAYGQYHPNDTPEEKNAVRFAERILSGTVYEKWIPVINEAILTTYPDGEARSDIARVVYDADSLDKLGNMGVAQFFAKKSLRRQFLNDDVMIRASIELTYAHHAPDNLKTETGRFLAEKRSVRTRRFYTELMAEWRELGLGEFKILEEDIAGVACILVVPCACSCGGVLAIETDILDAVKCRSAVVNYRCRACGMENTFSFCLPNIKGLPDR